jgi:predicted MPP superfamily phosphohydrolase
MVRMELKSIAIKALQILLLSTYLYTNVLYGVFVQGKIYGRFNEHTQAYQYIVLLSDIHIGSKALNMPQIKSMRKLISNLANDTLIVAEDIGSYSGSNILVKTINDLQAPYRLDEDADMNGMRVSPLRSLIEYAQANNIPATNLEHRFLNALMNSSTLIDIAQQPDLYSSYQEYDNHLSLCGITTKALGQEILDSLEYHRLRAKQISEQLLSNKLSYQECNDLIVIENYWKGFLTKQQTNLEDRTEALLKFDSTLAQYILTMASADERLGFLNLFLLTDDSRLLDIKALDTIAQARDKKKIILAMGNTHITRIAESLKDMNFTELFETNETSYMANILNDMMEDMTAKQSSSILSQKYPEIGDLLDLGKLIAMEDIETVQSSLGKDFNLVSPEFLESLSQDFDIIFPENK